MHIMGLGVLTRRGTCVNGLSILSKGGLLTITSVFIYLPVYLSRAYLTKM